VLAVFWGHPQTYHMLSYLLLYKPAGALLGWVILCPPFVLPEIRVNIFILFCPLHALINIISVSLQKLLIKNQQKQWGTSYQNLQSATPPIQQLAFRAYNKLSEWQKDQMYKLLKGLNNQKCQLPLLTLTSIDPTLLQPKTYLYQCSSM
jgi:hypothetical protein